MPEPTEIPGAATAPGAGPGGVSSEAKPRHDRRALLVGVQRYLDPGMSLRPGTCAAIRQIAAILGDPQHGGWQVEVLLDDEPAEERRPMLANLLERLGWLQKAEEGLLLLSGRVRGGLFLPRDARPTLMARTSLSLGEISTALPKEASVIVDANVDTGAFPATSWVLAAGPKDAAESFPNDRGPTAFMSALMRALQGEGTAEADVVTAKRLAELVVKEAHPAWFRGERDSVLARPGMRPTHCVRCGKVISDPLAVYCPGCGSALRAVEHLEGGRYRIIRPLGSGGMGTVYLAEDTRLKTQRALKLLTVPPGLPPEERSALEQRLIQECKAAQALAERSGHVVRVYDVGYSAERGEPFLVMELLQGRTLSQKLAEGRMSISGAVELGLTMAQTLGSAHETGIVHRDLKPDNVYLHNRGIEDPEYVKLLDFGLAKMAEADVKTQSGRMMGTLQYMPPEQLRGERVDSRADVFSLGAVLYECLAGERAVPGRTQGEIFRVLLDKGVRPLRELVPDLPPALHDLIERCLSLDATRRPANGREVAAALAEIREALREVERAQTVSPESDPGRSARERAALQIQTRPTSLPESLVVPERPLLARVGPAAAAGGGLVAVAVAVAVLLARGEGGKGEQDQVLAPPKASAAPMPADAGRPLPDAAKPAPRTAPPAEAATLVLSAEPRAEPRADGEYILYAGGTPDEQVARLIIDVTLSEAVPPAKDAAALARWSRATPAIRQWLAARVDTSRAERRSPDLLAIGKETFEKERERSRPSARVLPGVGVLFFHGDASPIFERVACGRAAAGDRLLSAQWSTPGYPGGRCDGPDCPETLARGLLKARDVGETSTLKLTLSREGVERAVEPGESGRITVQCRVGG